MIVHPNAVPVDWTELWTVVEWQDGEDGWHAVEDWQGMVDEVQDELGHKSWWVAPEDILSGPYRWVVYDRNGGELLGVSDPFNTPDFWREVVVEVGLDAAIAAQRVGTQVAADDGSGSLPGTGFATPSGRRSAKAGGAATSSGGSRRTPGSRLCQSAARPSAPTTRTASGTAGSRER